MKTQNINKIYRIPTMFNNTGRIAIANAFKHSKNVKISNMIVFSIFYEKKKNQNVVLEQLDCNV